MGVIGITTGHGERVTPIASEYQLFFELLRGQGRRTEPLDGALTPEALSGCRAVLLGDPEQAPDPDELGALAEWARRGGTVLWLGTHEGAVPVASEPGDALSALLAGASFHAVRRDGSPIALDAATLTGQEIELLYPRGVTIAFERGAVSPTHALPFARRRSLLGRGLDALRSAKPRDHYAFLRLAIGEGALLFFGSTRALEDAAMVESQNAAFVSWLVPWWISGLCDDEVKRRKERAQRHRLLHGYPMAPLMRPAPDSRTELSSYIGTRDPSRELLVGVLPHPYCNPSVKGCGFCTFPQEVYSGPKAEATVAHVVREIDQHRERHAERRRVRALYLGGGTANLTPPDAFRELCRALHRTFDLAEAEISLEGVPVYFVAKKPSLLEILREEIPARSYRISMGIQTFDPAQLRRMGRTAFGDRATFAEVVAAARSLGFMTSGDLLFDLPGQTLAQMREDVRAAIDLGLDQLGMYHLVMFEGLGTEWSRDRSLLEQLPDNQAACESWLALRGDLLDQGFTQTTLTNFERRELTEAGRGFVYERCGFSPEDFDGIGFGPAAISLFTLWRRSRGLKTVNAESADDYAARITSMQGGGDRVFVLGPPDMKILYLTRKVALLRVDRAAYRGLFGTDPVGDFPQEIGALERDRLVEVTPDAISLTPAGMFYADTIAGLFAWRRVEELRARALFKRQGGARGRAFTLDGKGDADWNDARRDPMG